MATLRCLGWSYLEGEQVCEEMSIPLKNIAFAQRHENDTCLLQVGDNIGLHVDIPIKQMDQILFEHAQEPFKRFVTHDLDDPDYMKKHPGLRQ